MPEYLRVGLPLSILYPLHQEIRIVHDTMLSRTPPSMLDGEEKPYKYRLESIGQAMSWIKEELVTLKESDKNLTDIFKKLQSDIQEIGDMCSDARHSYRTSRYVANTVEPVNQDLELSFEYSMEPEEPPVHPPVPLTVVTKALRVPQHQLTTSLSANDSLNSGSPEHKLKSSPSTSGNSYSGLEAIDAASAVSNERISRYCSVDSGIQFSNEPEVAPSSNAGGSSLFEEIFSKLGWQQGMAN